MITAIVFFVVTAPFCLWAAWSDLKFLKIPNILSILLAVSFVVVGIFVLPFEDYLWRLFVGVAAFTIGFVIYLSGAIGGGDIKFIAAMLPFVAWADLLSFMFLISIMSLAGVAIHKLVGKLKLAPKGWKSWNSGRKFPFGFSLAGALLYYGGFNVFMAL